MAYKRSTPLSQHNDLQNKMVGLPPKLRNIMISTEYECRTELWCTTLIRSESYQKMGNRPKYVHPGHL